MKIGSFITKLSPFCATGDVRKPLHYICIRDGKAIAVNGHILVKTTLVEDELPKGTASKETIFLHPRDLKHAFLFAEKGKDFPFKKLITIVSMAKNAVRYIVKQNKHTLTIDNEDLGEFTYPKTDGFYPTTPLFKTISLSPDYLKALCSLAHSKHNLDSIKLSFYEGGEATPVTFEVENNGRLYEGIIMPMRNE